MNNKKIFICLAYSIFLFVLGIVIVYCIIIKTNKNVFSNVVNSIVELQCQNDENLSSYGTVVNVKMNLIFYTFY